MQFYTCENAIAKYTSEWNQLGKFRRKQEINAHISIAGLSKPNFRLVGMLLDNALRMKDAIMEIMESKLETITFLKTARFFNDSELIQLYKSDMLSFFKYSQPLYHACNTSLLSLDNF